MAGKRRAKIGYGMAPLFDVEAFTRDDSDPPATLRPPNATDKKHAEKSTAAPATPVDYWVRGVFKQGDGQRTRTVHAVGMSAHLDADVARFVRYLREGGFLFADGRCYLIEVLGVGADDGTQISLGRGEDRADPRDR